MAQQHDVVIIGAGIAGLCAALQLQNEGLNVKIYDAADAAGGRHLPRAFRQSSRSAG